MDPVNDGSTPALLRVCYPHCPVWMTILLSLIFAKSWCTRQTDLPSELLAKYLVDTLKITPLKHASTGETHFSQEEKHVIYSYSYSVQEI